MKHGTHATLSDVARAAGVGVATASRAINGGVNVSPAALKKVENAVRKLGYLPNHAARILKGGRTKTIGLLVPSIADPFFARCAEAAEMVARAHDYLLILAVSKTDRDLENLAVLMRHRPDGLLIVPSNTAGGALRQFLQGSAVPIVTLDRPLPGCPSVLTNSFEASRAATLHLIEHGRRRILCFGAEPELYTIGERLRGYRAAMKHACLQPRIDTTLATGALAAEPLLRAHMLAASAPDAIFTLKNIATAATFQALQHLKISVPSQVALIGFDDFELAGELRPSVTVVQQPVEDVGRQAAELLFARIGQLQGRTRAPKSSNAPLVLANTLVLRSSCGCSLASQRLALQGVKLLS